MEDYSLDDLENGDGAPEESVEAAANDSEQEEAGEKVKPPVKKRIVKNPRPKLNKDRLAGPKGIPELLRMSKNVHWRGKGQELHDLDTTMSLLEHWSHRLFPQMDSNNFFSNLERLGMKREIQTYMRKLRMGLEGDMGEQVQFGDDLDDGIVEEREEEERLSFEDPFSSLLADGPQSTSQQVLSQAPPLSQKPQDISEELRERMERSRQQALERRRLRLAQQEQLSRDMDTEASDLISAPPVAKGEQEAAVHDGIVHCSRLEKSDEDFGTTMEDITSSSNGALARVEQAYTEEASEGHPEEFEEHTAATSALDVVPVVSEQSV